MNKAGKIQLNRRTLQNLTADEVVQVAGGYVSDEFVDSVDRTPSVNCPPTGDVKCCPQSCSD